MNKLIWLLAFVITVFGFTACREKGLSEFKKGAGGQKSSETSAASFGSQYSVFTPPIADYYLFKRWLKDKEKYTARGDELAKFFEKLLMGRVGYSQYRRIYLEVLKKREREFLKHKSASEILKREVNRFLKIKVGSGTYEGDLE